ncbi:hypothetical protein [Novosphingobium olei]|uniref:hypothetical protein n=1 Tax=Novosphingobium olei TaxID=2728851 RepID=UPI0030930E23|nr:MgtC/SapB family protein [Novosphingobium olei]
MSSVFSTIGKIAGVIALIPSPIQPIAAAVAAVANVAAAITAQPPAARGSASQVVIEVDARRPYVMGEGYVGGVRRYQRSYGADKNPYRYIVEVYCGHGPIVSIAPYFDYAAVDTGYYTSDYLGTATKLGECPESAALVPFWSGAPNWSSASKLSGCAAIGWNFKFSKKGKRYASGIPVMGAYGKWVKVYDPRKDSTFPGGSGAHRLGVESTYEWSENPALHYGMYAFGRYQNGKKVIGIGLPSAAIDWIKISAWANVCDANGWTIFGRLFEPGDSGIRASNLRDIAIAGGAEPAFSGAVLSVRYQAPAVSLGTITEADLGPGTVSVPGMRPYTERFNTAVPRYIDSNSNWEMMAAGPVAFSSLVTADGEEKKQEWPFNFVKQVNQAAQLAAYRVLDSREQAPIELPLLPQWRTVRPGECYTLDLPRYGLSGDVIVLKRSIDPATLVVKVTVQTETPGKHAQALAVTGVAPNAAVAGASGAARDDVADANSTPATDTVYDGGVVTP